MSRMRNTNDVIFDAITGIECADAGLKADVALLVSSASEYEREMKALHDVIDRNLKSARAKFEEHVASFLDITSKIERRIRDSRSGHIAKLEDLLPDEYFDPSEELSTVASNGSSTSAAPPPQPSPSPLPSPPPPPIPPEPVKDEEKDAHPKEKISTKGKKSSHSFNKILNRVKEILSGQATPMPTSDLIAILRSDGFEVGGKDPVHTLRVQMGKASSTFTAKRGWGWSLKKKK